MPCNRLLAPAVGEFQRAQSNEANPAVEPKPGLHRSKAGGSFDETHGASEQGRYAEKNCTIFRSRESYKAETEVEDMREIGTLALIVLVAGVLASLAAAQESVVTATDDLFVGLAPDPFVIEAVLGSTEHGASSRCVDDPTESDQSETSIRIGAILTGRSAPTGCQNRASFIGV